MHLRHVAMSYLCVHSYGRKARPLTKEHTRLEAEKHLSRLSDGGLNQSDACAKVKLALTFLGALGAANNSFA